MNTQVTLEGLLGNWCQKWLDWIFIIISPHHGNGTNDEANDGTPAGHNKSLPRADDGCDENWP
jgi:hypothetical protein